MVNNNSKQEAINHSLFETLNASFDNVCTTQSKIEELFLQALENQKSTWEKTTENLTKIEEEQKDFLNELRESSQANTEKLLGAQVTDTYKQWTEQLDEVANRVQQLAATPYKESLNYLNQSNEQFHLSVKDGIDHQQKIRQDLADHLKETNKMMNDLYETNSKMALSLFK